jgi:hypothetical protein
MCYMSSSLFFLSLLKKCEAAFGLLCQDFHVGFNMCPADGCNVGYVFRSARTNEKGAVLLSVLCICSAYYVVEIFRIYVAFESQAAVLIDV